MNYNLFRLAPTSGCFWNTVIRFFPYALGDIIRGSVVLTCYDLGIYQFSNLCELPLTMFVLLQSSFRVPTLQILV